MKARIALISLSFFLMSFASTETQQSKQVYICTGKYAKKYHACSKCRGLNSCKGTIQIIALSTAKNNYTLQNLLLISRNNNNIFH